MQLLPFVAGGVLLLVLLTRIPIVGPIIRVLFSLGLVVLAVVLIAERAPFDPVLARLTGRLHLDNQEVVGKEVRIRMSSDGHFWANVSLNGARRRMMIDSGATFTALSESTAAAAGLEPRANVLPILLRTANGMAEGRAARVDELRLGNIVARNLDVVVSPALGEMNLLGMNFLSKLQSWRVEGETLVLVPHNPQPETAERRTKQTND